MVRSLDILLRFLGGGPSVFPVVVAEVVVVESMPSGDGEPLCEVCCDAGGEGYAARARDGYNMVRTSSGGGEGDRLGSELSGEEGGEGDDRRLEGGDERSLPESVDSMAIDSAGIVDDAGEGAGRCGAGREAAMSSTIVLTCREQ